MSAWLDSRFNRGMQSRGNNGFRRQGYVQTKLWHMSRRPNNNRLLYVVQCEYRWMYHVLPRKLAIIINLYGGKNEKDFNRHGHGGVFS